MDNIGGSKRKKIQTLIPSKAQTSVSMTVFKKPLQRLLIRWCQHNTAITTCYTVWLQQLWDSWSCWVIIFITKCYSYSKLPHWLQVDVALPYTTGIFKGVTSVTKVGVMLMMCSEWRVWYRQRLSEGFHITSTHNGYVSLCVELTMKVSDVCVRVYMRVRMTSRCCTENK